MKQQQLESKLALYTALHEKLAIVTAKLSYRYDYLFIAAQSKREQGNFVEYTYDVWSEKDGSILVRITVTSQEGFDIYADAEYIKEDGECGQLAI